jgi:hypothetical protein
LRMPMFAATAAVPATITPATATAVISVVRVAHDFLGGVPGEVCSGVVVMPLTVRNDQPTGGKTKANVR